MPIVLAALLPITYRRVRDSESSNVRGVIFALSVSVIVWADMSAFQVVRQCRKLGWQRANLTQCILGGRPTDPDALLVWQWLWQICYAAAALALCVVAAIWTSQ